MALRTCSRPTRGPLDPAAQAWDSISSSRSRPSSAERRFWSSASRLAHSMTSDNASASKGFRFSRRRMSLTHSPIRRSVAAVRGMSVSKLALTLKSFRNSGS